MVRNLFLCYWQYPSFHMLQVVGLGYSQVSVKCAVISRCLLRKCRGHFLELHTKTKSTDIGSVNPLLVLFLFSENLWNRAIVSNLTQKSRNCIISARVFSGDTQYNLAGRGAPFPVILSRKWQWHFLSKHRLWISTQPIASLRHCRSKHRHWAPTKHTLRESP